ncbi:MAG TPA: hypothetical protein VL860_09890 [Planctomycetota bacterium]|nr:hypothetical protein [Planctomycetota bacterium]
MSAKIARSRKPTRRTPRAAAAPALKPLHCSPAKLCALAKRILAQPTAPFYEGFVQQEICHFVQARSALELGFDAHGNLLIRYEGRRPAQQKQTGHWVLTAHLDHPGMAVEQALPNGRVQLEMLGGVSLEFFAGAPIALFSLDRPANQKPLKARVLEARNGLDERGRTRVKTVIAKLAQKPPADLPLGPRWFAMWDLPPFQRHGDRLSGRVMDDLMGAVCALAVLDDLNRRRPAVRVDVLFTRAEEIGFGGMIAAARGQGLSRQAWYVNLECSSLKAGAVQGGGPVLRVGDYMSTFDPGILGALGEAARGPVAAGRLKVQRKLMDGGVCEATVLCAEGYRAGGACLALGNYHNMGQRRIEAETVSLADALGLIHLLSALVLLPGGAPAAVDAQRKRITGILDQIDQASNPRLKHTRPLFR